MSTASSLEQQLNPFPHYRHMQRSAPVSFDAQHGMWSVFRYDDVKRVLSDYAVFSSERGGGDMFAASLISADPPRHRQLRSLVNLVFTPQAVEALAPRITAIVHELLDQAAPNGRMDVIADLAYPLPVIVIAEMLGIPVEDRERFKYWSDAVVSGANTGEMAASAQVGNVYQEMGAYFMALLERRRQAPGDDLISGLLAAQIDGQHLTRLELLGFCGLLLVAGNETTTNLIGNAFLCFDEHPEAMERLRAEPGLLPGAIEEVLRYRSPVQAMFRTAVVDIRLADQEIKAYSPILAVIGSANHDEAQFPEPERFDIERNPNRHLAFGQGIHYCLGAPLARLEAKIALGAMFERLTHIRRVPDVPLEPIHSLIVYGVKNLPITFTPV